MILAGFVVMASADSIRRVPDPRMQGWCRFIPTAVLLIVPPISREAWADGADLSGSAAHSLARDFQSRLGREHFGAFEAAVAVHTRAVAGSIG